MKPETPSRRQNATFAIRAQTAGPKRKYGATTSTSQRSTTRDPKKKFLQKEHPGAMTKGERKEKLRLLKQKKNRNYGVIMEITELWERLRPKDVSEKQRRKLMDLAMTRVKGRVLEIVRNPKASRVLQSCLKHGSVNDRRTIFDEIVQGMAELSMSKYGKHLVESIIAKTPREEINTVFSVFPAKCTRLLRHQYGTDVMNELYCKCSEHQKHELIMACYGKECHSSLVGDWREEYELKKRSGDDPSSLQFVFRDMDMVRRATCLEKLHGLLNTIIEKGLMVNQLVHRLLLEFFKMAPPAQVEDMSVTLAETGDGLLKMLHTREGSAVAAAVVHYSDASHRKMILRAFKDYIKETATDDWGYVVLITALRVVDDTKMIQKNLLQGLVENLEEIVTNRYGRYIILDLLSPTCSWYLPQKTASHLNPRRLEITQQGGSETRVVGVSKKDALLRRSELLSSGPGSLADALVNLCCSKTASLLKCRRGSDVLVEVATGGKNGVIEVDSAKRVHKCIVVACMEDASLLTNRISKGALLQIMQFSADRSHAHRFCRSLWKKLIKDKLEELWKASQFVLLAAVAQCGHRSVSIACREAISSLLQSQSVDDWLEEIKQNKAEKRQKIVLERTAKRSKTR